MSLYLRYMRRNSSIQLKIGQCIDCPKGTQRELIAGRCRYHYQHYRRLVNKKKVHSVAVITVNKEGKRVDLTRKNALYQWFQEIRMRECLTGGYLHGVGFIIDGAPCMECGDWIISAFFKHATAHILPKGEKRNDGFPSVATHPLNYLILGASCGCHARWDKSWDDAAKMKVFTIAKERFLQFKDHIEPDERRRIPYIFAA